MNQKKQRMCLKCQQPFASRGPGHRICKPCKNENHKIRDKSTQAGKPPGLVIRKQPSND